MKPLAIVTPWFGRDLKGGAEQYAWQITNRLAARGYNVEVLTTCCKSFLEDWATNHLKRGENVEDNVVIHRFKVDSRRGDEFNAINTHMLALPHEALKPGVNPVSIGESTTFARENINSSALLKHLRRRKQNYHAFIFIPYLYGPILNGLPLVAEKAYLQPCLHDEVYAYLPPVEHIFRIARGIFYNSEGEAQLANYLCGPGIIPKSVVVGGGVETTIQNINDSPGQHRSLIIQQERFVLYLGRRDATKNTDLLARAYARFKKYHPASSLKLVLAGPGEVSYDDFVQGVVDLGLVSESEKETLLANCLTLFQPSSNESYSRVIMEAWLHGHPVAAHRNCLSTAITVESAHGGWSAETEDEWAKLFADIDHMKKSDLAVYGEKGHAYAKEHADWSKVIDRYEVALGLSGYNRKSSSKRTNKLKEIHQMTPGFEYGDAITNHTIAIRDHLRSLGYVSNIYVQSFDLKVSHEAEIFRPKCINKKAGLIYHHSIGSDLTPFAIAHSGTNDAQSIVKPSF